MFLSMNFQKIHLVFVLYFFIELSKRLIKDQQNKLFTKTSFRNLQMFLSHTISILFYLIQNKNIKQEMNGDKKRTIILFPLKNSLKKKDDDNKKKYLKKSLLLIFLSSILHLISYYPLKDFDLLTSDIINSENTYGLFVILLFLIEKKVLKSQFFPHHILSIILFSILNLFYIYSDISINILDIFNLVIYCIQHYLTLALIFNIYYFINKKYFISLYCISGIQGLISLILTSFFIIIYYTIFKESSIIKVFKNTKFNEYIWPFLVFICMAIQNILQILILYFFKPSFICIIYVIIPLIKLTSDIIKIIFYKDYKWNYSREKILLIIIYQFIILFSVLVYIEILVLNFCGFEKGVKKKIIIRSENEKSDFESLEINDSICKENRDSLNN